MKTKPLSVRQLNRLMNHMPLNRIVGFRVARVWKDGLTMEARVRDELKNLMGTLHGGVTAALIDAAAGIALIRHYGGQKRVTTVEMKVNYLRPVTDGVVRARAKFIKLGKTLSVIGCDVHDAHGHKIAAALVTYMALSEPAGLPPLPLE